MDGESSKNQPKEKPTMTTELKSVAESLPNLSKFLTLSDDEIQSREAQAIAEESAQRVIKANALMSKSGLPKRHLHPVIPTGEGWLKLEARLKARVGSGFIIALCGPRGTGKTQLAASCARETTIHGKTPTYTTAMGFFLDIKESFDGKRSEKEVIGRYCSPSLLILDEMQERGETAWEDRLLTHLIDRRYGAEKDTLLITNQDKESFLHSIGESVASRISETGGVALCNWESYRQKTN
jgi:DNA replication protein DnaC